jgi:hypothetical protein
MADENENRIREEAHKIWLAEGRPEGRAERHWVEAKEIVALHDGFDETLEPLARTVGEPVEPSIAFENQADVPELTDQAEGERGPNWNAAREVADEEPLSAEEVRRRRKG